MRQRSTRPTSGVIAVALLSLAAAVTCCAAEVGRFPFKPIKLIVYTKPGGPIDLTARRFVDVARRYTDATFVVENKSSSGGIAAFEKVLQARPDGHTLCACTKSNISKIVSAGRPEYLDGLDWVALLMIERECVITRSNGPLSNWNDLISDMVQQGGKQVWVGPASGGLDHVVAMQIWDRVNARATWIPHSSGGEALSAILRGEGVAYVGNPSDATGLPDLKVAAISSPTRLESLPEIPTFRELGLEGLDSLYMWRGFAVKKGTPPAVLTWYDDLFKKVTADPRWRDFWEPEGVEVVYRNRNDFADVVAQDREEFNHYLSKLHLIPQQREPTGFSSKFAIVAVFAILGILAAIIWQQSVWYRLSPLLIPAGLSMLVIVLWGQTMQFPTGQQLGSEHSLGAAGLPRIWATAVLALSIVVVAQHKNVSPIVPPAPNQVAKHVMLVGWLAFALLMYVVANVYVGYFVSTFLFMVGSMLMLGERRLWLVTTVAVTWLLLAYLAFQRLLYVPLPEGQWWDHA